MCLSAEECRAVGRLEFVVEGQKKKKKKDYQSEAQGFYLLAEQRDRENLNGLF